MKHLILTFAVFIITQANAQQAFVEIGRTSAFFKYSDSNGEGLANTFTRPQLCYQFGFRGTLYKRIKYTGTLLFNRYSVFGSDEKFNNSYSWDVQYLGFGVGAEADVLKYKRFSLLFQGVVEPQFLIIGTQEVNGQVNDLKGVEEFDRPLLFLRAGAGINYCLIQTIAISFRYKYGLGLPIGKTESSETLRIMSSTFSVGLLVSLGHCDYCHTKHFR